MSDGAVARANAEVATRNAQEAVRKSDATHSELTTRIDHLERVVHELSQSVRHLHEKYNLMLTDRFSGGSTVHD